MKPIVTVAGAFAGGVLAMVLLERLLGRAQRVVPVRQPAAAPASRESRDDAQLRQRVRSRLGAWVSHPGAIDVDVEDGVVRLTGQVLAKELDGLLSRILGVAGVLKVRNALDTLADPSGFGEMPQGRPTARAPTPGR